MASIGHNGGPAIGSTGWQRFAWQKARTDLLPTLPIEVVRLRVNRAKELGLPYKTYASVRAATGHDLIGFLFSSNALRLFKEAKLAEEQAQKLAAIKADRNAIVHRPLSPEVVAQLDGIDSAHAAPLFTSKWTDMRDDLRAMVQSRKGSADRFMLIGEGTIEREWVAAGQLAGFMSGEAYFAQAQG
ncbi:hypothetical protein HCZ30_01520 [Marivivens donghaensis]|uniref:Uncharacterized protein n=1 Tax=Marivivens donghaensis TaxID=1699413 RepID=A0ABX0VUJ8_9RHOB|nr:hypothetical protein [Marivivens donghaensis]NIY71110.1 hypothetical protein [Marivivens donghaensis]